MKVKLLVLLAAIGGLISCGEASKTDPPVVDLVGSEPLVIGGEAHFFGAGYHSDLVIEPAVGRAILKPKTKEPLLTKKSDEGNAVVSLMADNRTIAIYTAGENDPQKITLENAANDLHISPDGRFALLLLNENKLDSGFVFSGSVSFNIISIIILPTAPGEQAIVYPVSVGLKPSWVSFNYAAGEAGGGSTTLAAIASLSKVNIIDLQNLDNFRELEIPLSLDPQEVRTPNDILLVSFIDESNGSRLEKAVVITAESKDIIIVKNLDREQPSVNIHTATSNPEQIISLDGGRAAAIISSGKSFQLIDMTDESISRVDVDFEITNARAIADTKKIFLSGGALVGLYDIETGKIDSRNIDLVHKTIMLNATGDVALMLQGPLPASYKAGGQKISAQAISSFTTITEINFNFDPYKVTPILFNPAPLEIKFSADGSRGLFLLDADSPKLEIRDFNNRARWSVGLPYLPVGIEEMGDGGLLLLYDDPFLSFSYFKDEKLNTYENYFLTRVYE